MFGITLRYSREQSWACSLPIVSAGCENCSSCGCWKLGAWWAGQWLSVTWGSLVLLRLTPQSPAAVQFVRCWQPPAEGGSAIANATVMALHQATGGVGGNTHSVLFFCISHVVFFGNRKESEAEAGQRGSPGRDRAVPPAEGEGIQGQGSSGWFARSLPVTYPAL